jgi:hypothetical protein
VDLVDDYRLRAPTMDDLASLVDALVADELDDAGQVVLGEDFVRSEWDRADFDAAPPPRSRPAASPKPSSPSTRRT